MSALKQTSASEKCSVARVSASHSHAAKEGTVISLRDYLDAENERRRTANAEIAARVNVTKLKAMIAELKHRKKLSDEDDED